MKPGRWCKMPLYLAAAALWAGFALTQESTTADAAAAEPGAPQTAGRLEMQPGVPASLEVSRLVQGNYEVVRVQGTGSRTYEMWLEADGLVMLRFPGASLSLPAAVRQDERLKADLSDTDTLMIQAGGYRVAGTVGGPDSLDVHFQPVSSSLMEQAAYRIGVGDKLRLSIYGDQDFSNKEVRIRGNGTIAIPYLGEVAVAGLTTTEALSKITQELANGYLVDPKLTLEVIDYRSQWVNVSGEVGKPGRYYLKGHTRLLDIIGEAGGLKKEAGPEIIITRHSPGGGSDGITRIRQDELYLSDNPQANPVLHSDDSISVPTVDHFFIKGEVKSPGRYAVDHDTTVLKAISLAGGFGQYANHKKVELLRQDGGETVRMVINVERIENRKEEDVLVLPGDIINVKAKFL